MTPREYRLVENGRLIKRSASLATLTAYRNRKYRAYHRAGAEPPHYRIYWVELRPMAVT